MITRGLKETSDSEIAVGFVFVLPKTPKQLGHIFIDGSKMELSPQIVAHGELMSETTVNDMAGISFMGNETNEIGKYLNAGYGDKLNLDKNEITAFNKLAKQRLAGTAAKVAVETQLRSHLLNRFESYRIGGLKKINPYIREGYRKYFPGRDLDRALKAFGFIKYFYPDIYQDIARFPKGAGSTSKEKFFWVKLVSDGRPSFVLSHRMVFADGDTVLLFSRHFYASNSYNGQQEAAVLIPFEQGSMVYYNNRTYFDKVSGFGSDVKQAFGKEILASSLIGMFTKIRTLQ